MNKVIQSFVVVSIFIFSSVSVAGGGLQPNKITKVAFQTGGFFLYADNWPNPNECTRSDAIVLKSSDSNYDKAYSLLLAAYMSGKKVSGYSDGCVEFDGQTFNSIRGFKYLVVE
ncbi:hypothetical protein [Aliikangiella maris]|uniref:Uncharacterized protein n=2 Tax=Aliikangiella maris TaxID=3162458 RepID=A0ABV3MU32_9GAMM